MITLDGACFCCGRRDAVTSGGCLRCNSSRTFCSCGQLIRCGCGKSSVAHHCANVTIVSSTLRSS